MKYSYSLGGASVVSVCLSFRPKQSYGRIWYEKPATENVADL